MHGQRDHFFGRLFQSRRDGRTVGVMHRLRGEREGGPAAAVVHRHFRIADLPEFLFFGKAHSKGVFLRRCRSVDRRDDKAAFVQAANRGRVARFRCGGEATTVRLKTSAQNGAAAATRRLLLVPLAFIIDPPA
jgi:hypothetical protein